MYRHQGRLRRLTLGPHPNLPLADAREKARDELRAAAKGGDPAEAKKAARKAETFKDTSTSDIRMRCPLFVVSRPELREERT